MTILAASRAAARAAAGRRGLSTAAPKMHKAKGNWDALKAKRPIDHDETHLVFHPPFSPIVTSTLLASVLIIGWGSMAYGFIHQQYKQGYYKK